MQNSIIGSALVRFHARWISFQAQKKIAKFRLIQRDMTTTKYASASPFCRMFGMEISTKMSNVIIVVYTMLVTNIISPKTPIFATSAEYRV